MNNNQIIQCRIKARDNDSKELQTKRRDFLGWLMGWNFIKPIETIEMYPGEKEPLKSEWEIPQYLNKFHNTRKKIHSETLCETDKLQGDKMMFFICETIASLIRNDIHFVVFYAEGMRSPHIRIYDFEELSELHLIYYLNIYHRRKNATTRI